jgi:hypothetical protein
VKAGMIKVDTIEAGPDARWRTVTIVETKKQTLRRHRRRRCGDPCSSHDE